MSFKVQSTSINPNTPCRLLMMGVPQTVDWANDPYWRRRRISPAQLLIHDVRISKNPWHGDQDHNGPWTELFETLNSTLVQDFEGRDKLFETLDIGKFTSNRQEQTRLTNLTHEYGWMNCLRNSQVQTHIDDAAGLRKCRWIHIPSKYTEYLQGCLLALSDWSASPDAGHYILASLRQLTQCVQQHERFSKHSQYFAPFFESLGESTTGGPTLISVPFLDWTVDGRSPPLRFQIDPREDFQSVRGSAHLLRSILQHLYRLEDTSERESQQVFSKHKPWLSDRSLDLKVRRWYGSYPAGLNVDELWILVVDSRHIVTFSSNQSWKSRWPPLQFPARVAEVSFRSIRNHLYNMMDEGTDYTAYMHTIVCLSGALGLLHRNFWADLPLCLTDRFAGYLSHLQYRLLRSPSSTLVMDLLQVQEELNIIISIMQQQLELVKTLQAAWTAEAHETRNRSHSRASSTTHFPRSPLLQPPPSRDFHDAVRITAKRLGSSTLKDPIQQVLDNLEREFVDLNELRDNCNSLITRTIQLVNIRLEDHGKAVLVFTIVSVVFLPLSFVATFFGMNTKDIRNMNHNQGLFWIVSGTLTVATASLAIFLAFYGSKILETFVTWRANRIEYAKESREPRRPVQPFQSLNNKPSFHVLGAGL